LDSHEADIEQQHPAQLTLAGTSSVPKAEFEFAEVVSQKRPLNPLN
jgi:hypothetical protein